MWGAFFSNFRFKKNVYSVQFIVEFSLRFNLSSTDKIYSLRVTTILTYTLYKTSVFSHLRRSHTLIEYNIYKLYGINPIAVKETIVSSDSAFTSPFNRYFNCTVQQLQYENQ